MTVTPAVRVGILVFIALIAFTAVAVFLTGYRTRVGGYPVVVVFDDAHGLTQGSEVRMAGVIIGVVDKVTLDANQRAIMRLLINQKYSIPIGSKFTLQLGMLMGDKFIDINPKRGVRQYYGAGDKVKGWVSPQIEDMIPRVQRVLTSLEATTNSINSILGNKEFKRRLENSLANLEVATATLNKTMTVIQGMVVGQQDEIQQIIGNVVVASTSLRAFTGELEAFSKTGGAQANMAGMLQAARKSAESLQRSTESLEKLAASPELQEDVRGTARAARQAIEQANKVMNRVGKIIGVKEGGEGGESKSLGPKINLREPAVDMLFRPDDRRLRFTGYVTIPSKGQRFLRLGVYDIGNSNKGILQPGLSLNDKTDFRYGLYASKLSIGMDYAFSPRAFGSANLYDPDRVQLDLQAGYKLNDNLGLLFGVDKLFRDNQITIGARLTK